jgi:transposase
MERRKFSREFKVEAVQASRDLDVHANVLRRWTKELSVELAQAYRAKAR